MEVTFLFELLLILQRYYFESESQLYQWVIRYTFCCCLSYKDTILKANHSKARPANERFRLLLILQRYYFESESQPSTLAGLITPSCCLSYKDTILKANHSPRQYVRLRCEAVAYPTKILFWKRITADTGLSFLCPKLLLILQRYYFESESQQSDR